MVSYLHKCTGTCILLGLLLASTYGLEDGWLCEQVQEVARKHPHSNVIGFASGLLRYHNMTSIQDAGYPENCIKRPRADSYAFIAAGTSSIQRPRMPKMSLCKAIELESTLHHPFRSELGVLFICRGRQSAPCVFPNRLQVFQNYRF